MIALQRHWRRAALSVIPILILIQIVALSPSLLDVSKRDLTPEALLEELNTEKTLAPGVPKQKVPDYSVDGFDFVSTHEGKKQWKIVSNRAYFYQKEGLIHNRVVTAYLYDDEGQATVINADEGQYFPNQRVLEMFGNVVSRFPDGFETRGEYMRYMPERKRVEVPENYPVAGDGTHSTTPGQDRMKFTSGGLLYEMDKNLIFLPSQARVTSIDSQDEETTVESDRAKIDRNIQRVDFEMYAERPISERFTKIYQPKTFCQSRYAILYYGSDKEEKKGGKKPAPAPTPGEKKAFKNTLDSLTAYEDVLIRDIGQSTGMKYATAGQAEFNTEKNLIILTRLPQVYQELDTVTGDVIILHRDTDVVEVDQSNAYSEGSPEAPVTPRENPNPNPNPNPKSKAKPKKQEDPEPLQELLIPANPNP